MHDLDLRRLADGGSAEHQWLLSLAYRAKGQAGRAHRYQKKAFDHGYPDALLYQLQEWITRPGEHANFAAANQLLAGHPNVDCLAPWRWRLGVVAASFTPEEEERLTRQQVSNNDPAALRYVALRCALMGREAEARGFIVQAMNAGDEWARLILDDNALEGVPPLAQAPLATLKDEAWKALFTPDPNAPGVELAREPEVVLHPGWLPLLACRLLVAAASTELQPSLTYDPASGRQIAHPVRTSYSMTFMPWLLDPSIVAIQRLLAARCNMQPQQCEVLGLLRYHPGQAYQLHYDAFAQGSPGADQTLQDGGQRVRTALIYLNEDYTGGETRMENLDIEVKGSTGDLLIFDNVDAQGRQHPNSLHAGKPVESGTKWLLSQWYRERETQFTRQMNWL
jgi:hypothetical protein